jgi:ATP-dependent RNA helicase DDX35
MSATVDATSLKHFFSQGKKIGKTEEDSVVVLSVEGRTHPVLVHYVNGIIPFLFTDSILCRIVVTFIVSNFPSEPVPDYVDAVCNTVKLIHSDELEGDILAFLTGSEEIDRAVSKLKEQITDECNKYCEYMSYITYVNAGAYLSI